jgi:hypothetical protein
MRSRTIARATALAGVATLALSVSIAGAAPGNGKGHQYGKTAAKQCAKERKALGNEAFEALYGKPAQPNCVGVVRSEVKSATKNASQECKAERAEIGATAFADKYGKNANKRNAHGKCVSGKVKAELSEDLATKVNAAKACKAEQADPNFAASHDGKTFDQFYGTNANLKNAFGKCVSGKAKAQEPAPAPTA